MAISFNNVPAGARVPLVYVEFDSSRAGATSGVHRSLLIGQRLSAGTVAEGVPTLVNTVADAQSSFGRGSMLALMASAFRRQNPFGELWAVALNDATGGTQAEVTVTVGAASTAAGTIALYISGQRIAVGVASGRSTTQISTAIQDAVDDVGDDLPVTASRSGSVVTLTARNDGAATDLDVRHSYHAGESLPAGVTLAIATSTAGATDPNIQDALDAVADEKFNLIANPYSAASSMTSLEDELTERWGPTLQLDGYAMTGYRGTSSAATTYGNARNSPYSSVMGISTSPTPTYEWAAAMAGRVAVAAGNDPARPFQTLQLTGVLPAAIQDRFAFAARNALLSDGIATHTVDGSGVVRLERMISTYQTGPGGQADAAYLDANTALTLSFLRSDFRDQISNRYARYKLADDGTRFGAGQPIITPLVGRAAAVGIFESWEQSGLVEDAGAFSEALVVERNSGDRNRLDFLLAPNLVNQLRVVGAQISFIL